ncbi:MAG: hypothetical protein E6Q88_05305 [Lysobacteraceae bacterium]|nr:MAG: hypothetical protein E6Q88_05305 [Xanthomonadaceae bacterium]
MITGVVKAVTWLGTAIGQTAGWIVVNFGNAWDKVKSIVGSAVDWMLGKIAPLVRAGEAVAGALGFGSSPDAGSRPAGLTPPRRPPGRVPAALRSVPATAAGRSARGGSSPAARKGTTGGGNTYNVHVTQQPGESSEAFAQRVVGVMEKRDAVSRRGRLSDGADD